MEFIKIKEFQNINNIYKIWNNEFGYIFPITLELFKRNLENAYDEATYAVLDEEKIIGFIIGKIWNNEFKINVYDNTGWISLIYVIPSYRNKGLGTKLLLLAEEAFKKAGKSIMYLGKDLHDFFPGLPVDLVKYKTWFLNRGFEYSYSTYDLIKNNVLEKLPIKNNLNDFTFRTLRLDEKDQVIDFLNKNWPGRWTYEALEYFEYGGNGSEYLVCLNDKNEICAFTKVCYPQTKVDHMSNSHTWRARFKALGGIGPLGVTPSYRGRDLGYDIVASAVNLLIEKGATDLIIDWTGLLEFYRKMGFEVWKSYFYMYKKI